MVTQATVRNALVFQDSTYSHRWYDAFGPGVVKYLQEFVYWPKDDSTGDPTEWTLNITEGGAGSSTAVITDQAGGALLITTDNQEDDGWQMQLGQAAGENVKFDGAYPLYFGIQFQLNDVTQTDCLFGLCVTDTDCLGAVTDGMYFRSVDASALLYFVTEKDSVESATAVATMVDATDVIAEFYFDGSTVHAYINNSEVTSTANSATTFCNNEELRLTIEYLTGEAVANNCTIKWLRMIHIR